MHDHEKNVKRDIYTSIKTYILFIFVPQIGQKNTHKHQQRATTKNVKRDLYKRNFMTNL